MATMTSSRPKSSTRMSEVSAGTAPQDEMSDESVVEALPAEREEAQPSPESLGIELPDDPEEALQVLASEVAKARDEAGSYLDDLKRVAADFDNYRKRTVREQAGTHLRAAEKVIVGLMPVLDTFDAALATDPSTDGERQLFSGMVNTREQLLKALGAELLVLSSRGWATTAPQECWPCIKPVHGQLHRMSRPAWFLGCPKKRLLPVGLTKLYHSIALQNVCLLCPVEQDSNLGLLL